MNFTLSFKSVHDVKVSARYQLQKNLTKIDTSNFRYDFKSFQGSLIVFFSEYETGCNAACGTGKVRLRNTENKIMNGHTLMNTF